MNIDFDDNLKHKDCLGKFVKVKTIDALEHEGWLKCIDPMSGNLFLVTFDENFTKVTDTVLIFGGAYVSLEGIKDTDDQTKKLINDLYQVDKSFSPETAADRKKRLVSWIKKHRLPVCENEDETLLVCESVTISPPYEMENCSSLNGRVLKSIRQLVWKLPNDVESHACETYSSVSMEIAE